MGPKTSTQYARSSLTVQSKASRPSPLKTERGPIPTESISMHRTHADGTLICGTLPPCLIPVFSCHTCCTLCIYTVTIQQYPSYASQCGREVQHRRSKQIFIRMRPGLSALNGIILMQISRLLPVQPGARLSASEWQLLFPLHCSSQVVRIQRFNKDYA